MIELFSRGLFLNCILVIELVQKRRSSSSLWVVKSWRRHGFRHGLSVPRLEPLRCHGGRIWPTNMLYVRHASGMEGCVDKPWRWQSRPRYTGIGGLSCCAHWRCDCDSIGVRWVDRYIYAIPDRKKCVETLNEIGISMEKTRDTLNDTRCVYPEEKREKI